VDSQTSPPATVPYSVSWSFWDRKIGPFFDEIGVMHTAALTLSELETGRQFNDVLALEIDERDFIYPSFQFGRRGELLPGLRDVVCVLRPAVIDNWDIALWIQTASVHLEGRAPVLLMRSCQLHPVVSAARADANNWKPLTSVNVP
jgi:hypothetical protein